MSDQEHREHPIIHYFEVPIGIFIILLLVGIWALNESSKRPDPVGSNVHSPAVRSAPFRDGDIVVADERRTIIPGVEVKTGRKAILRRHLPYDGAGPESASYELVAGHR